MDECPICKEPLTQLNVCKTKCGHSYCLTCIIQYFKNDNRCPLCRIHLFEFNTNPDELLIHNYEIHGILRLNQNLKIILIASFIIIQFSIIHLSVIFSPLINYIKLPGNIYS